MCTHTQLYAFSNKCYLARGLYGYSIGYMGCINSSFSVQILVRALDEETVKLEDISLLIFDECHLTHGGNPGNCVMRHYLKQKLDGKTQLPQVSFK